MGSDSGVRATVGSDSGVRVTVGWGCGRGGGSTYLQPAVRPPEYRSVKIAVMESHTNVL